MNIIQNYQLKLFNSRINNQQLQSNPTFGMKQYIAPKMAVLTGATASALVAQVLTKPNFTKAGETAEKQQIRTEEYKINETKEAAVKILNRSIVFGPKEYEKLSKEDIIILREYGEIFKKNPDVRKSIDFTTKYGKIILDRLHEKYSDGFIFVSVGRSLALFAKYLEFHGEDVKYCPISWLKVHPEYDDFFLCEYKKYLDNIGLTRKLAKNTQKTIVMADYNNNGTSLNCFRNLMSEPLIGISEGEKVKYAPLTPCKLFEQNNWIFSKNDDFWRDYYFDEVILDEEIHKKYTSIPYLSIFDFGQPKYCGKRILDKYYQNGNRFEENFATKMMNFLIADSM